jgi:hypothetical protein
MDAVTQTDSGFAFRDPSQSDEVASAFAAIHPAGPLGPLAQLPGTWKGHGFNTIWRPHHGGQDRFLELNETTETLVFTKINGPIPNRGLLMPDIDMFGLTYMQQISETSTGAGLHIEPGIWAHAPRTTNPSEPPTVVRMASIPHGTVILAQGTTQLLPGGPHITDNNIIPFFIGSPPPANSDFPSGEAQFPELNLSIPSAFRLKSPGVTQAMVKNPNVVIQADPAVTGHHIKQRTFIQISSRHHPVQGGGTANTAFLDSSNPPGGNARAVEVDATFWIQTVEDPGHPDKLQLQYTQLVMLNFNGLSWPHVTVATLHKQ